MIPEKNVKRALMGAYHHLSFFLLMAFIISCCMALLMSVLDSIVDLGLDAAQANAVSKLLFWCVMALSLVCTIADAMRRKFMIDRPVRKIVAAADLIAKGDYSVRIPALNSLNRNDGLDEIVECFNQMAQDLSGVESLRTDFVANVSHELKTPISIMQNYGTLLQLPDLSEEDRVRYAKSVSAGSKRLAGLVSNILKLNKLESQQIFPQVDMFNLSTQLIECLLGFEEVWEDKEIAVETDLDEEIIFCGDGELLSIAWNNLISNALKFTPSHGRIGVKLFRDQGTIVVSVSDSGQGIDLESGKHIFDKFYQGDTSHATEGNGLGLALVKRVVEILNGDIRVESEVGSGSTFTVRLPESISTEVTESRQGEKHG